MAWKVGTTIGRGATATGRQGRRPRPGRSRRPARGSAPGVSGTCRLRAADGGGRGLVGARPRAHRSLGLWTGAGGPFGRVLTVAMRGSFGLAGYAFPVVAAYWALLLLRGTAEEDRGRMLVGLSFAASASLGIAVDRRREPEPGGRLRRRGGRRASSARRWDGRCPRCCRSTAPWSSAWAWWPSGALVFTATPLSAVGRGIRKRLFVGRARAMPRPTPASRRRPPGEGASITAGARTTMERSLAPR